MSDTDDLYLPQTKLSLSDGTLRKYADDGSVMASFELSDLTDIRCVRKSDFAFPLVLAATLTGLGFVAKQYVPSEGMGWTAAVLCWGVALFCLVLINSQAIVLETNDGQVAYNATDGEAEAEGFVMSVKQQLKHSQPHSF